MVVFVLCKIYEFCFNVRISYFSLSFLNKKILFYSVDFYFSQNVNTDKTVSRGHLGTMTKWPYKTCDLLKEVNTYAIFLTGQEKGDLSMQVTA